MKSILPHAAAFLGLSISAILSGCVHITNTYTGLPTESRQQQNAQTVAGHNCGCQGHTGAVYSQGGYPYPVYYPHPYQTPPPADRYYYPVPYGYPHYGNYPHGGSYPPSDKGGNSGGGSMIGGTAQPVESKPRGEDGGDVAHDPRGGTPVGGPGPVIGINPNLGGVSTAPRDPRADDPHDTEVRPNIPSRPRETAPVEKTPERDTRPNTGTPVATADPRANAPHDVTVRPNTELDQHTSTPRRDTKPATGTETDVRPSRERESVPARSSSAGSHTANPSGPAQRESISPATQPTVSQPRRESGSAATTTPANTGVSARPGNVDKARETAATEAGSGSKVRRETAPVKSGAVEQTAAPAEGAGSKVRDTKSSGEGTERANAPAAARETGKASDEKKEGTKSAPRESVGGGSTASPVSRTREGRPGGVSLTPRSGSTAGTAGSSEKPE